MGTKGSSVLCCAALCSASNHPPKGHLQRLRRCVCTDAGLLRHTLLCPLGKLLTCPPLNQAHVLHTQVSPPSPPPLQQQQRSRRARHLVQAAGSSQAQPRPQQGSVGADKASAGASLTSPVLEVESVLEVVAPTDGDNGSDGATGGGRRLQQAPALPTPVTDVSACAGQQDSCVTLEPVRHAWQAAVLGSHVRDSRLVAGTCTQARMRMSNQACGKARGWSVRRDQPSMQSLIASGRKPVRCHACTGHAHGAQHADVHARA